MRMDEYIAFENLAAFRAWLEANHVRETGVWIVYDKKPAAGALRYEESLEEAISFGWIDSLIKRLDETRYARKLSPRKPDSKWSVKNKAIAERLIAEGRMTKNGFLAVEAGKRSGNWDAPSRRPEAGAEQIAAFAEILRPYTKASAVFTGMTASQRNLYASYYLDAKREDTRQRRLKKIAALIEEHKTIF